MKTIFQGIVLLCLVLIFASLWTAYDKSLAWGELLGNRSLHMLAGLSAALVLLAVHGFVILNYFIATGKAVDQALEGHPEFAAYKKRIRKLKGRTFPFATMSAIFIIVAAVLGGLAWRQGGSPWHMGFAWFAVAFNLFSFYMEYKSIKINMALLDEVRVIWAQRLEEKKRRRAEVMAEPPDPAPTEADPQAEARA